MDIRLPPLAAKITASPTRKASAHDTVARPPTKGGDDKEATASLSLRTNDLKASLASVPVVDQTRVARLSNELQSGHYRIDPQITAQKIIEFEQGLP